MLGIILFILKILGILLLIVLGLVLFILFLVFFAPIKYKSSGYKQEDGINVQAFITYLNPLVRIYVIYPEELIVQVKILWFTVYTVKSEKGKSQDENKTKSTRNQPEKTKAKESASASDVSVPDKKQSDASASAEVQKGSEKKKSVFDTVKFYASLLQENKKLILDVLKTVINALKTILPRKCYVKAAFGTGQADTTGYVYAVYCALLDFLPGETEIILEPVWIEKALSGEYSVKGKIRLIHFLIAIIKIIADPNVRRLYKKIRSV